MMLLWNIGFCLIYVWYVVFFFFLLLLEYIVLYLLLFRLKRGKESQFFFHIQ
jgi:hypothetical protein